ncbi:MAG: hypothetical protein ACOCQD_00775 [archaeon]
MNYNGNPVEIRTELSRYGAAIRVVDEEDKVAYFSINSRCYENPIPEDHLEIVQSFLDDIKSENLNQDWLGVFSFGLTQQNTEQYIWIPENSTLRAKG